MVVGQKSGVVHALDPDQEGKVLWQTRVGKGGALGGIMWGSAADQDRVYVANSDLWFLSDGTRRLDPAAGGGLFALDLANGKIMMQVSPVPCGEGIASGGGGETGRADHGGRGRLRPPSAAGPVY